MNWYFVTAMYHGIVSDEYLQAHSAADVITCVEVRNGGGQHVRGIQCVNAEDVPQDVKTMVIARTQNQRVSPVR